MKSVERRVAREAKAVTRKDVILKAIEGKLSWLQAADILGITPRHICRLKKSYEQGGWGGLRDHRAGALRRKRLPVATIRELLKAETRAIPRFFHPALLRLRDREARA